MPPQSAPPPPSPYLLTPTTTQFNTLNHASTLLHLFHHRNKNQHRRSVWWRALSTFRRQLSHLLTSYTSLLHVPETATARHKKKLSDRATTSHIQAQLTFWTENLVPRWMAKFSNLVADGRWAVLGVFLMGVLAEVCGVVGVTAVLEESAQREFEEVLGRFEREAWEEKPSALGLTGRGVETRDARREGEDVGVVLTREEHAGRPDGEEHGLDQGGEQDDELSEKKLPVVEEKDEEEVVVQRPRKRELPVEEEGRAVKRERTTTKQKKKEKKGRDAIDDLFSGL